tara:strand:- start:183885 stop:185270 length:1386 start_codon:yes stop_codon:yes gene_type:complete
VRILIFACTVISIQSFVNSEDLSELLPTSVKDVVEKWTESASRLSELKLSWTLSPDPIARFSRYRTTWLSPNQETKIRNDSMSTLELQANSFLYRSERWAVGNHCRDRISNDAEARPVVQYSPLVQRMGSAPVEGDFLYAHSMGYLRPELEFRPTQEFSRALDGSKIVDRWYGDDNLFDRITIRSRFIPGSLVWTRLVAERDVADQVNSLELQAALLALRRIDSVTIGLDRNSLSLLPEKQAVHGHECLVIEERATNSEHQRRFWIDPLSEFVVRRFMGIVRMPSRQELTVYGQPTPSRFGNVLIDIFYESDERFGLVPSGWTVVSQETAERPVQAFSHSSVMKIENLPTEFEKRIDSATRIDVPGAWVIDDVKDSQWIVRSDLSRREITSGEVQQGLTYDRLASSASGEATFEVTVDDRVRNYQIGILAAGVVCVCLWICLFLRRCLSLRVDTCRPVSEQ